MMRKATVFGYTNARAFQALELPYLSNRLSMVVILPRKIDGLAEVEKRLDVSQLEVLSQMEEANVVVELPKFKCESGFELEGSLAAMGMTDAFSQLEADNLFRGVTFSIYPLVSSSDYWVFKDNFYDEVAFWRYWLLTADEFSLLCREYSNLLQVFGDPNEANYVAHDVKLTGAQTYYASTFGNYSVATSSPLYKAGSCAVPDSGLFHNQPQTGYRFHEPLLVYFGKTQTISKPFSNELNRFTLSMPTPFAQARSSGRP